MNEAGEVDIDKVTTITEVTSPRINFTPNRSTTVSPVSLEEGTAVENKIGHQQTGEHLKTTEDDTDQPSPDGRKSWVIVVAVTLVLACASFQSTLQSTTLSRFGKTNSSFAELRTNKSTVFAQTEINDSSFFAKTKANETKTKDDDVTFYTHIMTVVVNTQAVMFSLFGVVSATLIVIIGYRWVSLIGGVLLGAGCLGAAFCDGCSVHLIAFLYGALPGMGQAMLSVSTTVAILEHFEKRRLTALLLPQLGVHFATLLISVPGISVIEGTVTTWRGYLFVQAGGAGVVIPFSLLLKPLKMRMADNSKSSFVSRVCGIEELKIYRNPTLYTFALVWFLWDGGYAILQSKLSSFKGRWIIPGLSLEMVLMMTFTLLPLIGTCISCCIPHTISPTKILTLVSTFCVISGLLNLVASQLYDYIYAIVFYGILGIIKGVASPVLEFAIPVLFGEDHVEMGTGFLAMGQSLGGVTMSLASGEIEKITRKADACFYLAGALFICGFGFTVVTFLLIRSADKMDSAEHRQNQVP